MLSAIVSSAAAYAATNLDDLFVLMLRLAACRHPRRLAAGHILGVGTLTAIGLLGALGLQRLPLQYTGLLGFVPILLGVRALLPRSGADEEDVPAANDIGVFGMALTTLGNGADNLGVYIPLFTGFTGGQCLIAVLVFTVLTALWLWLAQTLAGLPRLHSLLQKYRHIAVPAILLPLGICILLGSGLFG